MTEVLLRNRDFDTGQMSPDRFGRPFVLGTIGFLTYATSADPTNEALSSTTDANAGHVFNENTIGGVTLSLTAGTITVPRDGNYRVTLILTGVTAASNSANIAFILQKGTLALTNTKRIAWINAVAILPGLAGMQSTVIALVKGDAIRAVFTGSVGGVVTINNGSLSVEHVSDATIPTQV